MAYPNTTQLAIAYLHFYIDDLPHWRQWFTKILDLQTSPIPTYFPTLPRHSILLQSRDLKIILSAPDPHPPEQQQHPDPVKLYLEKQPCGIVDVAFFVEHTAPICRQKSQEKPFTTTNPVGFQHTFIPTQIVPFHNQKIDHFVLNVPQGQLTKTMAWYEDLLGFQRQQSFVIQTDYSSLSSQVLVHPNGIQIPINQPGDRHSQIQEFLDYNGGSGIQHVALKQEHLPQAIEALKQDNIQDINFLSVPKSYYQNLLQRHPHLAHLEHWSVIQSTQVLVDVVRSPRELLLQIFTQPIFKEPTFFFEFIERKQQAQGFGAGNFQALFEAVEQAQKQRLHGQI